MIYASNCITSAESVRIFHICLETVSKLQQKKFYKIGPNYLIQSQPLFNCYGQFYKDSTSVTRGRIYNTSFSSYLTNGPNKLECYIKLGWKAMPVINTLVFGAHSEAIKKMTCCYYGPWVTSTGC